MHDCLNYRHIHPLTEIAEGIANSYKNQERAHLCVQASGSNKQGHGGESILWFVKTAGIHRTFISNFD